MDGWQWGGITNDMTLEQRGARFSVEEMLMIGEIIKVIKNNREKGGDANEYGAVLQK